MTESIKTIKGRTLADIKSRKDIQVLNNKVGYMINITELGAVRDDSTVTAMNRILTLSTCAKRSNQRFLVQGVLLNDPLLYGVLDD